MPKFIACYKVCRGGEWFELSLESVCGQTDGAVVVFSERPWAESGLSENCSGPLARFRAKHPEYPVVEKRGDFRRGEPQYDLAMATIREAFGEDASALIVDSDEVWEPREVGLVRAAVENNPEHHYFRAGLYSYLRTPYYQVWPLESPSCCVAIRHCQPQPVNVRFATQEMGSSMTVPGVRFHHFSYVREDPRDIELKFRCTSEQEQKPSRPDWLGTVWEGLPGGTNLHMTPGFEHVWPRVRVIPPFLLPAGVSGAVPNAIDAEERRWRKWLQNTPPSNTLIPTPHDAASYADDSHFYSPPIRERLQTTYLESLWIREFAGEVPFRGKMLEIGCGHGASTAVLATASVARVHAVDPFEPYDEETHAGTVRGVMEGNEASLFELAGRFRFGDRLQHFKCRSDQFNGMRGSYDLVFVDGNHSYDVVVHDLRLAWSLLKPGGVLLGHDYTTRFPGVIRAADESGLPIRTPAGTSLFYARKG